MTNKEIRLLDVLKKVAKESKKASPDLDKIYELINSALEYETRNS